MRVEYDHEADAAYLCLVAPEGATEVARTVPVDPSEIDGEINLDFDRDGRLVGIEIQDASRFLDAKLLRRASGR
jgi:uncharacterized protein YuzE